ncbi:MAG TPA: nuclear transport factor 2 family protein [Kofleriaceae bacterium]|nr:nuclear transport factor 2 family protein [Kofleriaceae bacterium]
MSENLERVRQYLTAIERGATGDALAVYFTPDVVQEEFPNRLVPAGARRDLAAILDGAVRGQKVLSAQRFEILHALVDGDRVALEVQWIGTLAIPLGATPVGGEMRARFGVFIELRDGKICAQRNYDCFDPF